jgi:hypothetical protein
MGDFLFSNTGGFMPADLRNGSALKKDAGGVKFFAVAALQAGATLSQTTHFVIPAKAGIHHLSAKFTKR